MVMLFFKVKADIKVLQSDFEEMNNISKNRQLDMEQKVNVKFFEQYKDKIDWKIDDLTNHSKRNNLVFWNVLEGDEKENGCVQFIQKAHRSPLSIDPQKQQISELQSKKPSPRPIQWRHEVKLLSLAAFCEKRCSIILCGSKMPSFSRVYTCYQLM